MSSCQKEIYHSKWTTAWKFSLHQRLHLYKKQNYRNENQQQYFDMLKEVGASANTTKLMMHHGPSAIKELKKQLHTQMMSR